MKNVYILDRVMDMFKILADNEYSLLWDLVEDFTINGHEVSIKESHQFKQVIIDGRYESIGGIGAVISNGVTYTPLEYVRHILEKPL